MKKFRVLLILTTFVLVCGCKKDVPQKETTSEQPTENIVETTQNVTEIQEETIVDEKTVNIIKQEIEDLLFYNVYYNLYVFRAGSLPPLEGPFEDSDRYLYQIDTSMFKDYAEFENDVRSVYVKETADMLLYSYPYEGKTKYVNDNGMLCIDYRYAELEENYVDWYNYTFEIDYIKDKECGFTVYTTKTLPTDETVKEDYSVSGRIFWDDGYWYLENMLY